MTTTVGVFGLGSMGSGIASSVLRGGFDVLGHDIALGARDRLVAAGGRVGEPDQVLAESDVIVLSVMDDTVARAVLFDGDAVKPTKAGAVVICTSTCSYDFIVSTAKTLAAASVGFVDAPVSGGPARAATGELATYACGEPASMQKALPVLMTFSKPLYEMGEKAGLGTAMKLFNQLVVAGHLVVGAQGLAFAKHLGLDMRQAMKMVENAAGNSWVMQNILARHVEGDYEPRATLATLLKDVRIIEDVAIARGIYNPVNTFVLELLEAAGREDGGLMKDGCVVGKYIADKTTPKST